VAGIGATRRVLQAGQDDLGVKAFAPVMPRSSTPVAATRALRSEAERALGAMAARAASVVHSALSTAAGCTPGQIGDAIAGLGTLGAGFQVQERRLEDRLRRLAALALRLVEHVLERLSRFLPACHLGEVRRRVRDLADSAGRGDPAVTALALDIPNARHEIDSRLARLDAMALALNAMPPVDVALLDQGTADLVALARRFDALMAKTEGVLTAVVAVGQLLASMPLVMEVRPVVLASAALAVTAAVVMTGRDYVDSGSVLGLVRGVRHVVATACGEGT
jgi:hypothetical protein